ncbi:MAG: NAD-dependent epimerase/dehydratase family protein, partial [Clostridiales bacterium]|nr:NAD-dependent epimerase/dehydratase family protein [Clostridiales bacterium]
VIHAAGIVSIASKHDEQVYHVNVNGTKNIVSMCKEAKVEKLIYVSSVHAIEEKPKGEIIRETKEFSPDKVVGLYAKTKAEATAHVLQEGEKGDLWVNVVHPSGILGPYDYGKGNLSALVIDYCSGALTSIVSGGYDFVDVRDVAKGIVACLERGKPGECYILSNQFYTIQEIIAMLHQITGRKNIKSILPNWFVKATAPLAELYYKILNKPPLYTRYSLYTLDANAIFSHEKADRELQYVTRDMKETLYDMVQWLIQVGQIKPRNLTKI